MKNAITASHRRAISILKPSKKELEHGLELHRDSIVFDAYGFSPMASGDEGVLLKAVEAGASSEELRDLREEIAMTGHLRHGAAAEYRKAWNASGVTCVFQNAGEEGQSPLQMLKRLARYSYCADMCRGFLMRATLPEDVKDAKAKGHHCLYMTTNGVPLRQEWRSVESELGFIRVFFQLGCRMMHMTYNRRNMLGDGCMEVSDAGLSDFGRAVVAEMNHVGVICDVAHSGWRTSSETAKQSVKPVVSSHSSCDALHHHQRAKPDAAMKAIADSGGYHGICCVPDFLGGAGDISSLLDHVDYALRRLGADHVAIGTDQGHVLSGAKQKGGMRGNSFPKTRPIFESFWPSQSAPIKVDSSLAWTNWPLFHGGACPAGTLRRNHKKSDWWKCAARCPFRLGRLRSMREMVSFKIFLPI